MIPTELKKIIKRLSNLDSLVRALIFAIYFSLFLLALYAPLVQHFMGYPSGENVYTMLSPICHQYPTRCFWTFDRPWALCARCSSAYGAIALSAVFIRLKASFIKRSSIGLLLISLAAIDPLLQLLGYYESTNFLRLLTGIVGGIGVFLFLYPIPLKYRESNK